MNFIFSTWHFLDFCIFRPYPNLHLRRVSCVNDSITGASFISIPLLFLHGLV